VSAGAAARTSAPPPVAETPQARLPALAPTRPPADLGMVERYGLAEVEQMKAKAFAAANAPDLSEGVAGFLRGYATLESKLATTFANTDKIRPRDRDPGGPPEEDKVTCG